jgi:hypothetical protein
MRDNCGFTRKNCGSVQSKKHLARTMNMWNNLMKSL